MTRKCSYWFKDFDGWQPCHCDGNTSRHEKFEDKQIPQIMT